MILPILAALLDPSTPRLRIEIVADPAGETLRIELEMEVDLGAWPEARKTGEYWFLFTEPARMVGLTDKATGKVLPHRFEPMPGMPPSLGIKRMRVDFPEGRDRVVMAATYLYTKDTFTGFFLNPSTDDNLHFGQIRKESIFASHLRYYPSPLGGSTGNYPLGGGKGESARIKLVVPAGWTGVTAGTLVEEATVDGRSTFTYEIAGTSGRLPYPFAIYPYRVLTDRNVTIYFAERDRPHAAEKLALINQRILPFLTRLMGPPPFEHLRVIEVFPFEGNTGLAARDVVMLSERIWFAAPIGEDLTSTPAVVLVDEIAHQWNFYKVRLPNFLAEGVSEYTDAMFVEQVKGRDAFDQRMAGHQKEYTRSVEILNRLREMKAGGIARAEIAKRLRLSEVELAAYWPYAEFGDVPISDPRVFPKLYFLKGALALHALRTELGDSVFLRGFRSVFTYGPTDPEEVSLDRFRSSFETVSGRNLEEFFRRWYK